MSQASVREGRAFIREEYERIFTVEWDHGIEINVQDAMGLSRRCRHLTDGQPYCVLVDMTRISAVAPPARAFAGSDQTVAAVAFFGSGPMDQVLAAPSEVAEHPARFFFSRDEALAWLRDRVPAATDFVGHVPAVTRAAPGPSQPRKTQQEGELCPQV